MHSLLLVVGALTASAAPAPSHQGVLLDFTATWCGPCRQMNPLVERLARQGYPIRKVDVDREPELARKYGIKSIPAFVLVVNGQEVSRSVGAQSETALKRMMAQIPEVEAPQRGDVVAVGDTADDDGRTVAVTAEVDAEDQPNRGFLPRIKLPLFGSKSDPPRRGPPADEQAVIRGNNDDAPRGQARRVDRMASSTRIRIKDGQGINYGSGTIIDSVPGRTIILTCGHIFRGLGDNSRVEVDVFIGEKCETFLGKVLRYDLEADVGLITIASEVPLPHSNLAAADEPLSPGDEVYSIGCGGGEEPSRQNIRVSRLNPYLGPDNLECTGVPVQGRSGGGLFNSNGEVVGVCVAADPKRNSGLYAGLAAVRELLHDADVAQRPAGVPSGPVEQPAAAQDEIALNEELPQSPPNARQSPPDAPQSQPVAAQSPPDVAQSPPGPEGTPTGGNDIPALPAEAQGAEVICIIRSHDDPRESSRVVIINRASPKFLSYLRGELEEQPQPTSARMPIDADERTAERQPSRIVEADADVPTPAVASVQSAFPGNHQPAAQSPSRWRTAGGSQEPSAATGATPQRYRRSAASRR